MRNTSAWAPWLLCLSYFLLWKHEFTNMLLSYYLQIAASTEVLVCTYVASLWKRLGWPLRVWFRRAAAVSAGEAESGTAVGSGRRHSDVQAFCLPFCGHHPQTDRKKSAPWCPQQDLSWYVMDNPVQAALQCVLLLRKCNRGHWCVYMFLFSTELLKRLDDGSEEVRSAALVALKLWLSSLTKEYDPKFYAAHLQFLFQQLLLFLDDPDSSVQEQVLGESASVWTCNRRPRGGGSLPGAHRMCWEWMWFY